MGKTEIPIVIWMHLLKYYSNKDTDRKVVGKLMLTLNLMVLRHAFIQASAPSILTSHPCDSKASSGHL